MYEYLLIARYSAMKDKIQDALMCTADCYRKITDKDDAMKKILSFFNGNNARKKKDALRDYLKENPQYRTKNPKLLYQRLRLTRKYSEEFSHREIPEHPIQDAIDELNTPVEESQEAPPKDEEFLE